MSANLSARVDGLFEAANWDREPGFAAVLLEGGEVAWSAVRGLAHLSGQRPITPETRFRICSITKPMFALVLAALEAEGRLSLGDPLDRYLPELRLAHRPTLADALAMKSGVLEGYPLQWMALGGGVAHAFGLDQALSLQLAQSGSSFAPGERTLYANANYILLQLALERVTGEPCARLMRRYVFSPAGMTDAVLDEGPCLRHDRGAQAYAKGDEGFVVSDPDVALGAAGAALATINDMAAWCRWLRTDPYDWRSRLAGPVLHTDGSPSAYARGFGRQRLSGQLILGHSGGIAGWLCDALWAPDLDVSVVILGNRSDINWIERTREMLTVWSDLPPDPAMTPRLLAPDMPEPLWSAEYGDEAGGASLTLKGRGDALDCDGRTYLRAADGAFRRSLGVEPVALFPEGDLASPPEALVRVEGNTERRFVLATAEGAPSADRLTGVYANPDMPAPVRITLEDGTLKVAVGPRWPAAGRLALRPVVGRLFRAFDDSGAPHELHLTFEFDGSGPATGTRASFLRIPDYPLRRLPDVPDTAWERCAESMPRFLQ